MMYSTSVRAALAATFITGLTLAAGEAHARAAAQERGLWADLWSWIDALGGSRLELGSHLDPNGTPRATTEGDSGGCIDPNGGYARSESDSGASIDPNGSPREAAHTPTSDGGGAMDPNGAVVERDDGGFVDPNG